MINAIIVGLLSASMAFGGIGGDFVKRLVDEEEAGTILLGGNDDQTYGLLPCYYVGDCGYFTNICLNAHRYGDEWEFNDSFGYGCFEGDWNVFRDDYTAEDGFLGFAYFYQSVFYERDLSVLDMVHFEDYPIDTIDVEIRVSARNAETGGNDFLGIINPSFYDYEVYNDGDPEGIYIFNFRTQVLPLIADYPYATNPYVILEVVNGSSSGSFDGAAMVGDIAENLTAGIGEIATGIGGGLQDLVRSIFLAGHVDPETDAYVVDGISITGIVIVTFAALSLALGLGRWVLNFCTSFGERNR